MFDMVVLSKFTLLPVSIDGTEQVSEIEKMFSICTVLCCTVLYLCAGLNCMPRKMLSAKVSYLHF